MRDGRILRIAFQAVIVGIWLGGLITSNPADAAKFNRKVDIGSPAPAFHDLPGIDGKKHRLDDYKAAKVLVVVFTCNHCPVAQLYEDRLIRYVADQKPKEVALVAISCSLMPQDSLDKMKERAKEKRFNFDYLADPKQQVGHDYGATVTPQCFVLDAERKIAYMGKFDDSIEPDKVKREFVRDAVRAVLGNQPVETPETRATGCGIEYEKSSQ